MVGAAVGWVIVWLAVRRPAVGEPRADAALRLRSARVAVGLAMAVLGVVSPIGGLLSFVGVFCWIATVNPPRPRAAAHT